MKYSTGTKKITAGLQSKSLGAGILKSDHQD